STSRRVDREIGAHRLDLSVSRRAAHPCHAATAWTGHELLPAALGAQLDPAMRLAASARSELHPGARLWVSGETQITRQERIATWPFHPEVQSGWYRDGAHGDQVTVEAGEQLAQRMLPAGEQRMDVPALGNTRTIFRVLGQRIALQHHHMFEMIREGAG